ncbi:hypothetical protein TrRE_jg3723 [Triparma retinervis]|uniref:Phytanoyl-CoA dioxygenase n=1 Tax=Triparma retinervis TaxID=2557542 RepID=A0A9W7AGD1_9STRA|nr:hypothetical protein TrRE_jg3723 [Triparma retinervis]
MMAVALKLIAVWFVVFCAAYVHCGAGGSLSKEIPVVGDSVESALTFELSAESSPGHFDSLKKTFDEHGLVVVKTEIARKDEMVAEAAAHTARGASLLKEISGRDICYDLNLPYEPFSTCFQVTDFSMRAFKRFDVRLGVDSVVRSFPENPLVLAVARKLLNTEDVRVLDVGVVVACPGATMQHWHKDDSSSRNRAIGIFFPLVPEPDIRFGAAEFQAGTHFYGDHNDAPFDFGNDPNGLYVNAPLLDGEFLVYDYLASHRGTPNTHDTKARPLLWAVLGGLDYEKDEVNWAPIGCEMDTECARQEALHMWDMNESRPQLLTDWFAYLADEDDEDWGDLKDYTEEQFTKYYAPEGGTKYREGFNGGGEGEEL